MNEETLNRANDLNDKIGDMEYEREELMKILSRISNENTDQLSDVNLDITIGKEKVDINLRIQYLPIEKILNRYLSQLDVALAKMKEEFASL